MIPEDGDCLFAAYLSNVETPEGYTVLMLHRQLVAFVLNNSSWFQDKIHPENESMESYLHNLASGLSFGDCHCLEILSVMWHMTVSIVNPFYKPIKNLAQLRFGKCQYCYLLER